jgi:hypothetical protein
MKKFAQIADIFKKPGLNYVSYIKDEESAGYILAYYDEPLKPHTQTDWFLELEDLIRLAETELGIDPESWKD